MPHRPSHRRLSAGGSYLLRRGSSFYFRTRVPLPIVGLIGRRELVRTLATFDPRLARCLTAAIGGRIGRLWERLEAMGEKSEAARLLDEWFSAELDRAWRQFQADERSDDLVHGQMGHEERRTRNRAVLSADAAHRVELMQEAYSAGRFNVAAARSINAKLGTPVDETGHRFSLLAAEALSAAIAVEEAREEWAEGRLEYRPAWRAALDAGAFPAPPPVETPPVAATVPAAPVAPAVASPAADTSPRLADVIHDHLRFVARTTRATPKDLGQREAHLNLLIDAFGADRRIGSINKPDAGKFWKALQELPPRFMNLKELKKLDFWGKAKKATTYGMTPMNPRTVNSYMGDIRAPDVAHI